MSERRQYRSPLGDTLTWITGEDATGGAYSLHEREAPLSARSRPHVHTSISESFYVLDGSFTFEIDGVEVNASVGDFVAAPAGMRHGWRVNGDAPARALVMFMPSMKRAYLEELDDLMRVSDLPPDVTAVRTLSERYGWT